MIQFQHPHHAYSWQHWQLPTLATGNTANRQHWHLHWALFSTDNLCRIDSFHILIFWSVDLMILWSYDLLISMYGLVYFVFNVHCSRASLVCFSQVPSSDNPFGIVCKNKFRQAAVLFYLRNGVSLPPIMAERGTPVIIVYRCVYKIDSRLHSRHHYIDQGLDARSELIE